MVQVKIGELVTSMGGVLHTKASLDVNFVIVKNVLAAKYKVWLLKFMFYIILNYLLVFKYLLFFIPLFPFFVLESFMHADSIICMLLLT